MGAPERPPLEDLTAAFTRHAHRMPVAETTVRAYVHWVGAYADWLAQQTKHAYEDVVTDEVAATHAARDFRRYLLTERKLAPKSVDSAITAIGSLYSWFGMPRPDVKTASPKKREPKSLDEEQVRAVLRAAERRGVRDHALVMIFYAAGLRIEEVESLDADDVQLSERKGLVIVRAGKGDKQREVPLDAQPVPVLRKWARTRRDRYELPEDAGPFFVTEKKDRLAKRSIHHVVAKTGEAAGVPLHPHMLRHTFGRTLIDNGVDLPTVADLMGHSSVNTTMGYVASRASHREAAVARLAVDY